MHDDLKSETKADKMRQNNCTLKKTTHWKMTKTSKLTKPEAEKKYG